MSVNPKKHSFSLEMQDRNALTYLKISNNTDEVVLVEGYLGSITKVEILEDLVLEIQGDLGTLRMDIESSMIRELMKDGSRNKSS